ncbi:MAG: hypothetical protein ACXU99_10990 [Thermodesulfobacteriota bacterium]
MKFKMLILKERRTSEVKKMLLGILVGTLIFGTVSIAMAGPFTWRETRQQARIYQGVDSGQITWGENQRLEREQGRIEADRQRAWADGKFTPREACRLTREQNRASRDIWRAKHNRFHY